MRPYSDSSSARSEFSASSPLKPITKRTTTPRSDCSARMAASLPGTQYLRTACRRSKYSRPTPVKTPAIAVTFSRPSGATTAGSLPPRAGSVTRREADASAPEGGEGETGASRWRADLRGLRSQLARAGATASRSSTTAVTVRRERVIIRKSVLEGAAKKMSTRTIFSRCDSGRELAGGDLAPLSDHLALQRYRAGGGSG
mmetsp:Transcript_12055/g.30365  ORF Transcript_12055/g.30365 Transcript_12055/m.30365 type:complete len:200 (+) Transcript_12055:1371-1970(+)